MEVLTTSSFVEQCLSDSVLSLFDVCTCVSMRVMQHTLLPLFSHYSTDQKFGGGHAKRNRKSVDKGKEEEDGKLLKDVNKAGFEIFKNVDEEGNQHS